MAMATPLVLISLQEQLRLPEVVVALVLMQLQNQVAPVVVEVAKVNLVVGLGIIHQLLHHKEIMVVMVAPLLDLVMEAVAVVPVDQVRVQALQAVEMEDMESNVPHYSKILKILMVIQMDHLLVDSGLLVEGVGEPNQAAQM